MRHSAPVDEQAFVWCQVPRMAQEVLHAFGARMTRLGRGAWKYEAVGLEHTLRTMMPICRLLWQIPGALPVLQDGPNLVKYEPQCFYRITGI